MVCGKRIRWQSNNKHTNIMKIFKRKKKIEDLSELYKSFTKVEPREVSEAEFQRWRQAVILNYHPINRQIFD